MFRHGGRGRVIGIAQHLICFGTYVESYVAYIGHQGTALNYLMTWLASQVRWFKDDPRDHVVQASNTGWWLLPPHRRRERVRSNLRVRSVHQRLIQSSGLQVLTYTPEGDLTQTLHGTAISADQLEWRQGGQWGGIYGPPMECMGNMEPEHGPWEDAVFFSGGFHVRGSLFKGVAFLTCR